MEPPVTFERKKHNNPIVGIWENIPDSKKVFGNMSAAATISSASFSSACVTTSSVGLLVMGIPHLANLKDGNNLLLHFPVQEAF